MNNGFRNKVNKRFNQSVQFEALPLPAVETGALACLETTNSKEYVDATLCRDDACHKRAGCRFRVGSADGSQSLLSAATRTDGRRSAAISAAGTPRSRRRLYRIPVWWRRDASAQA